MAEGVGFEPTVTCATSVFKTGAFDHSATPPLVAIDIAVAVKLHWLLVFCKKKLACFCNFSTD